MGLSYDVAVRTLCEFTAKQGDLDARFTPSPTAQEGIAGHQCVAGRRGPRYQSEVTLSAEHGPLCVRGRADGYDPDANRLEEIKTHRGDLARVPDNHRHLHWAQARVYGHMLCQKLGLDDIELALVYFDIGLETETVLRERWSAADLARFFAGLCERFAAWAAQEAAHRAARDAALAALPFPHAEFRPGQRQLAQAVYQANAARRCLMVQAPTGIGKTLGTLFPALKAMSTQQIDKLFYLAAKTPGRQLALDAAATLQGQPRIPLRVLELSARDKACEHPDMACHGESCPLARGFYDRLPAARAAALEAPVLDRAAVRAAALAHEVCPYYLASEMARWADVVVGDYNYYFDGGAMLYALTLTHGWRVSVLADEAHNLVSRARSMYSAQLERGVLRAARKAAPPYLRKALDKVGRAWPQVLEDYEVQAELPARLVTELQGVTAAITDLLAGQSSPLEPDLQHFYFDALQFVRLSEQFGPHSLCDLTRHGPREVTVSLRNVVPAHFLAARFAVAHSCTLFSATLSPWHYYSDMLGLPADTPWIEVDSPFEASQLDVRLVQRISTRYQHRARSVAPIATLIARQFEAAPGNYLAFFSSFDYLEQVADALAATHPELPCWRQARRMEEHERSAFLERFEAGGRGIGFAVLGGAFGEGIDLPGDRLVGAFVATLGLPQLNPVNEQLRARMDALFGAGYDYTYLYPGLQKVVQAAGRVIRTRTDRGIVYLIDDRFAQAQVRELLPRWWSLTPAASAPSGSPSG